MLTSGGINTGGNIMKITGTRMTAVLCAVLLTAAQMQGIPPRNAVPAAAASSDSDLIMHYSSSAGTKFSGNAWDNDESFYKALPLGNGRIGAMVYGNCPTERFDLNEATFWSGGPG
ncbi:MAG TPA: hypothetical protein DCP68_08840, partial [Ruminococcus sp.]|nr:hypothetical protein [Ruminococcus sp.]